MKTILLVDTYNMIHRARFGWKKGEHSITFNFFRSLKSEIDRHNATKVYVVLEGRPFHRIEESNGEYKANRAPLKDESFHRQKRDIIELCKLLPVSIIRHPDYECDDVIGTLSEQYKNDKVVICSSDSDFIQLLNLDNVKLWNPVRKKFIPQWPVDYITWKSLRGDATDNILGIKGVGDKTAMKLAKSKETLEEFLEKKNHRKIFESAKNQITLVTIPKECPKWEKENYSFCKKELKEAFTIRHFNSIIEKSWNKWVNTLEGI